MEQEESNTKISQEDFIYWVVEIKYGNCCSIIIPPSPGSGGIIFKKMEIYFSKIITPYPQFKKLTKIYFKHF